MRAGELRHRITFKGTTRTVDARWGVSNTATTEDTVWARVRELKAAERFERGQVQTDVSYEILIRHRADITDRHTIEWEGRTLQITGITADERKRELVIEAREQPAEVAA
jgi:SPP1 family predicted phage head-tail adaptor